MEDPKEILRKALLKIRPFLSEKSLVSYISTLMNLPKKLNDQPKDIIKYFSENVDNIIIFLKLKHPRSRKSVLSPLVVLTDNDKYKKLMQSDIQKYDDNTKKQEKTLNESMNWIEWADVIKNHNQLKLYFLAGLRAKEMSKPLLHSMNSFVLLSFFVLFPPRRALDYAVMKYQNYDKEKDNYIDFKKKQMIFNEYKTNNKYGKQTFDLPVELSKILKQWIKLLDKENDYIIMTKSHETVDITKMLNEIFKPKKVSVNMLRHSFLTNHYKEKTGIPDLLHMEDLASKMGHSVNQQLLYLRKD